MERHAWIRLACVFGCSVLFILFFVYGVFSSKPGHAHPGRVGYSPETSDGIAVRTDDPGDLGDETRQDDERDSADDEDEEERGENLEDEDVSAEPVDAQAPEGEKPGRENRLKDDENDKDGDPAVEEEKEAYEEKEEKEEKIEHYDDSVRYDEDDFDETGAYSTVVTSGVRPEFILESPRSVEAISKGELLRGAGRSTPEVLENTPGVVVQKTNHGGGSPFIRGFTGQHVLFMVDGVRLNNSTTRYGPNQMLNTVDSLILRRMEVLRGPGSVLYGSDAIGGVIQLFTRDAPMVPGAGFRWGGEALARGSTADWSQVYNVGGWTQYGNVGVSAGGSFKHFNDLRGGRGVGMQEWTGYHEGGWDGSVKVLLGGDWMLKTAVTSIRQVDVPRTDKCSPMDYRFFSHQDRDMVYAKLTGSRGRFLDSFETIISYQRYREVRDRYRIDRGRVETERDNVHTAGLNVKAGTDLGRYSRLSYGLDLYHDWVYSTALHENMTTGEVMVMDGFRGRFVDGSRYLQGGLFLYDEIKFVEWMIIHLGGRVALSHASIPPDPLADEYGFVSQEMNKTFIGPVGGASVTFVPLSGLHLVTSVQQGFRAPNLNDYSHVGSEGPAFDLPSPDIDKAETSTTLEAGAKLSRKGFFASVFGHYSFLRNFIARKYTGETLDGQPTAVRANSGKGYVAGIEGRLGYRFSRGFSADSWVSWTRGDIEMDFQEPTRQPIQRMSPLQGAASVSYLGRDKKWAKVVLRWSARQDRLSPGDLNDSRICPDGPDGCTGTPGFAIVSLAGGIPINSYVDFSLHINNLTNEKYKYHGSGVYGPGLSAIAQLRVNYR